MIGAALMYDRQWKARACSTRPAGSRSGHAELMTALKVQDLDAPLAF
jgi:hypothetical protein